MKVKDLVGVCTSATCFSVWAGGQCDEDSKYCGSFGIFEKIIDKFGEREVISIYPACKDVISIEIEDI